MNKPIKNIHMAGDERLHLRIFGRVQGVFFRDYIRKIARQMGLTGWVCNTDDGAVECVAEGTGTSLVVFLEQCKLGTPWARVDKIEESWEISTGEFDDFKIEF